MFALFSLRAELVTFVARHPRLSRYNIYVTMFYKVLKTFFFFLAWLVQPLLFPRYFGVVFEVKELAFQSQ